MLEIVIGNESLDLYPDEVIEINMKQSDVRDFAVNFNSFTREFTVPASPKNNRIFREYWNPSVLDKHLTVSNIPTKLFINKVLFRVGSIKIAKATVQDTITTNYTISFSTDLTSVKDILSGIKLNQLTSHMGLGTFRYFNYGDQFIYPRFPQENSFLEFPLITTKYLTSDYKYENINSQGITKEMLRPAIQVKKLISAFPGISITEGSFYDDPLYENLYLYLNASEDLHSNDIRPLDFQEGLIRTDTRDFMGTWINIPTINEIGYNYDGDTPYVYIDRDDYVVDSSSLMVNITGRYIIHIQRLILNDDLTINEQRTRAQDNEGIKSGPTRNSGSSILTTSGMKVAGTKYGYRYYIQPLGTISINSYEISTTFQIHGANYQLKSYRKRNLVNLSSNPIIYNPRFDIIANLPDITCYDLLISLVKMFNLIITPSNNGNYIRLDYYNSFFGNKQIDLTNYVSNSYEIATPPIPNNLTFKHEENDFYLNKMWQANQIDKRGYGDVVLNGLTNNSSDTQEVSSKFSTMIFHEWESNPEIKVSTTENESQEPVWGVPILLVNNGLTTSDGDKLAYKNDDGTAYPISEWKHFDMVYLDDAKSILFSNDIPEVDGLYETHYKVLTERLYSPYNVFMNIEATLPRHLYDIGLGATIIVKDKRYTIDEMKLNLITGKANLKLNNVRDYVEKQGYSVEKIRGLKYKIRVPEDVNEIEVFYKRFGQLNFDSFPLHLNREIVMDLPLFYNLLIKVDGKIKLSHRNEDTLY